jgi:hypothetical protein
MKLVIALALALTSSLSLAQSSSVKVKKKTTTAPAPAAKAPMAATNVSTGSTDSATMKILKDRLQVRYFAEFLGPQANRWDDNQVDADDNGRFTKSSEPINMFNQFSIRWRVKDQNRLAIEPRFTTHFGDRNELGQNEDTQVVRMEDFRIRYNMPYWASADKVYSTVLSVGNRFPTSRASKDANIVAQPEFLHITNFQATPSLSFSLWNQLRYYWYESKVDRERYRFYTGPSMTYVFNDTFELFVMYEHELQHNQPEGKRAYNYTQESLQDTYMGVNININPSFTIYPFIRLAQLKRWEYEDQRDTAQIGAWLMGSIF